MSADKGTLTEVEFARLVSLVAIKSATWSHEIISEPVHSMKNLVPRERAIRFCDEVRFFLRRIEQQAGAESAGAKP